MDPLTAKWLSELDMEEATINLEIEMNDLDYFNFQSENYTTYQSQAFNDLKHVPAQVEFHTGTGHAENMKFDQMVEQKPIWTSSQIVSFGDQNIHFTKPREEMGSFSGNVNYTTEMNKKYSIAKMSSGRSPVHAQDHVIAERKRREKLSQRFIALSALIPGLHKMDKATVLGDATNYLKQLQEKVKTLQEHTAGKAVESVVYVKKTRLSFESDSDNSSSLDENFECKTNQPLPEIEARISENNVLIRIHCEKCQGFVPKIISEVEKLHLNVTNSIVLPFGSYAVDITVVAQMKSGYSITEKDVVKTLKHAFPTVQPVM